MEKITAKRKGRLHNRLRDTLKAAGEAPFRMGFFKDVEALGNSNYFT
jgi:hypothetical protein